MLYFGLALTVSILGNIGLGYLLWFTISGFAEITDCNDFLIKENKRKEKEYKEIIEELRKELHNQ